MESHDIDELYAPAFLNSYKYWPDDGLFKSKLVANIWNNKIIKDSCDKRSTHFISF